MAQAGQQQPFSGDGGYSTKADPVNITGKKRVLAPNPTLLDLYNFHLATSPILSPNASAHLKFLQTGNSPQAAAFGRVASSLKDKMFPTEDYDGLRAYSELMDTHVEDGLPCCGKQLSTYDDMIQHCEESHIMDYWEGNDVGGGVPVPIPKSESLYPNPIGYPSFGHKVVPVELRDIAELGKSLDRMEIHSDIPGGLITSKPKSSLQTSFVPSPPHAPPRDAPAPLYAHSSNSDVALSSLLSQHGSMSATLHSKRGYDAAAFSFSSSLKPSEIKRPRDEYQEAADIAGLLGVGDSDTLEAIKAHMQSMKESSRVTTPDRSSSTLADASPSTEKPFKCPYPDCPKTYKNANGLKYHLHHHHSEPVSKIHPSRSHQSLSSLSNASSMKLNGGASADSVFTNNLDQSLPLPPLLKLYWCKVAGCGKKYKNLNGLKYHVLHFHPELDWKETMKDCKVSEQEALEMANDSISPSLATLSEWSSDGISPLWTNSTATSLPHTVLEDLLEPNSTAFFMAP